MAEKVTFRLDKIVRDKILQDMLELGQEPQYRELEGDELIREGIKKVQEEANELLPDDPDRLRELVQLQSAVNALVRTVGITREEFSRMVEQLEVERGGFEKAYYVGDLTLKSDDPWVDYYRKDPVRYPELKDDVE